MKKPKERKVRFSISSEYPASWYKYLRIFPDIKSSLTEFNKAKRTIPPARLPDKMQDHSLSGALHGIRECHLDHDVLLLYTHKDDEVRLLLVCQHSDIKGKKSKEMAKRIASAK